MTLMRKEVEDKIWLALSKESHFDFRARIRMRFSSEEIVENQRMLESHDTSEYSIRVSLDNAARHVERVYDL
ncbi:MAG: hypothetical protein ACRBM6_31430 [Geminicoccales bacterium]